MAADEQQGATQKDILQVLSLLTDCGFDVIQTENLYTFDGEMGFALDQGH